ncbi:COG3014 family protein [Oleiharenicola lentus]|uniref:COG3014 family protein n=1 Tax=Oleiharenicola lentus TaxID=2508720 RepID=UPI003F660FA8
MHTSIPTRQASRLAQIASAVALVFLATGCATYQAQTQQFAQATKSGGLASSIAQIDEKANKATGSKDELVYRFEQGATLRFAALSDLSQVPLPPAQPLAPQAAPVDPAAPVTPVAVPTWAEVQKYYLNRSIAAFDQAEEKVNFWEEQSKVKVGSEFGALVSNQASLPYRGRVYDKVMMNTYKAISYLELGEKDKARVELNRSLQRQRDAVAANEKRIAAAMSDAEKARNGELKNEDGKSASYDSQKALNDPKTGPALQAALNASIAPMKPYGDYVNPFSVFLDGLFFTVLGEGGSDFERGRKSFERVASMVPENSFLKADLDAAALAAEGKAPEGITYVIFETGTAPTRDQTRVDIPTFLVTSKLSYVGASFPKLQYNNDYIASLGVTAGESTVNTATVASIDSVVANDFKNEWPTVVTKTLITTATKAIVQYGVQKVAEDKGGMWGGLAAGLIMGAVNASTNIADTRTWISLPKEFQYARLATPANRELTLTAGTTTKTVALEPGAVNVVYVKSASPSAPLLVSAFVLK